MRSCKCVLVKTANMPLTAPHRPSPRLQVELPERRSDKTFSKEEAERAWRSTPEVAWIHGPCSKGTWLAVPSPCGHSPL